MELKKINFNNTVHERLIVPKNLAFRHQTPTLIGCMFLKDQDDQNLFFSSELAAISEALNSNTF